MDEKNRLAQVLGRLEREEKMQKDFINLGKCDSSYENRKRQRRTADKIQRHYKCQVANCNKSYGSEGSLNQHIRLKHPEINENGGYKDYLMRKEQLSSVP